MLSLYEDDILVWYVENRTAHSKSQYAMWACGISAIAFYPNKDVFMGEIESDLMQVFYDPRALNGNRKDDIPKIIPEVDKCYSYADKRYLLGDKIIEVPDINLDDSLLVSLKNKLLRKEIVDKYGYETITLSYKGSDSYFRFLHTPFVQNFEKTEYKVSSNEELFVFVQEFIKTGRAKKIRYCEVFVSAYKSEHQQIFFDAGLSPRGYVPSWTHSRKGYFKDHILFNYFDGQISGNIQLIDEGINLIECLGLKQ